MEEWVSTDDWEETEEEREREWDETERESFSFSSTISTLTMASRTENEERDGEEKKRVTREEGDSHGAETSHPPDIGAEMPAPLVAVSHSRPTVCSSVAASSGCC